MVPCCQGDSYGIKVVNMYNTFIKSNMLSLGIQYFYQLYRNANKNSEKHTPK